jgi:hypothetical protein
MNARLLSVFFVCYVQAFNDAIVSAKMHFVIYCAMLNDAKSNTI